MINVTFGQQAIPTKFRLVLVYELMYFNDVSVIKKLYYKFSKMQVRETVTIVATRDCWVSVIIHYHKHITENV